MLLAGGKRTRSTLPSTLYFTVYLILHNDSEGQGRRDAHVSEILKVAAVWLPQHGYQQRQILGVSHLPRVSKERSKKKREAVATRLPTATNPWGQPPAACVKREVKKKKRPEPQKSPNRVSKERQWRVKRAPIENQKSPTAARHFFFYRRHNSLGSITCLVSHRMGSPDTKTKNLIFIFTGGTTPWGLSPAWYRTGWGRLTQKQKI